MNSQSNGYIQEIEYQKRMINNLQKWLKVLLLISSLGILFIYIFTKNTPLKIFGIILLAVSIILGLFVGLAIYNGRKNVNKVIDEYASIKKTMLNTSKMS